MKVIFIGDIYGKIGRRAVAQALPAWRHAHKPDFVIANNENMAHGVGITESTVGEMLEAGVDCLTGGNHTFKGSGMELLLRDDLPILRPANYPPGNPGRGDMILKSKKSGGASLLVINLIGRVFFLQHQTDDPFRKFDEIIRKHKQDSRLCVFVDFHTEATSEQNAFAYYADGRASAVVGTHTHIGTVDARVLSGGTAHVTDVGAVAAIDSVIGEKKENIIQSFLLQQPFKHEPVESGLCNIGAVLVDIDGKTGRARSIKRIDKQVIVA